jgi:hypothetical protein
MTFASLQGNLLGMEAQVKIVPAFAVFMHAYPNYYLP